MFIALQVYRHPTRIHTLYEYTGTLQAYRRPTSIQCVVFQQMHCEAPATWYHEAPATWRGPEYKSCQVLPDRTRSDHIVADRSRPPKTFFVFTKKT